MKTPLLDLVEMQIRVPRGYDGFWSIICEVGADGREFRTRDIDGRSNVSISAVRDYLSRLVAGGWVEVARREMERGSPRNVYRLVRTNREAPRLRRDGSEHPETARDRMWRSMKMLGSWTAGDLAEATRSETTPPVPLQTVKTYVARLVAAGVVLIAHRRGPSSPAVYRLLRNVGAAAPRILRSHAVFDPNSKTVIGIAQAEEVL